MEVLRSAGLVRVTDDPDVSSLARIDEECFLFRKPKRGHEDDDGGIEFKEVAGIIPMDDLPQSRNPLDRDEGFAASPLLHHFDVRKIAPNRMGRMVEHSNLQIALRAGHDSTENRERLPDSGHVLVIEFRLFFRLTFPANEQLGKINLARLVDDEKSRYRTAGQSQKELV